MSHTVGVSLPQLQFSSSICFFLNLLEFLGCLSTFSPIFLLTPPTLDHPVSGSILIKGYPLFNLNPSRPPPRPGSLLGSRGQSTTDRLTPDLLLHKCLWKSADIRREAAVSEGSNKLPVVKEGIMGDMTEKTCCDQSENHMESLSSGTLLCMSLKDNTCAY